jgi:HlyD family secretion protein
VTQNVTTYSSIIDVANPGMTLKPGMTANIRIEIARRTGVLRVANAALRFRPTAEIFTALKMPQPSGRQGQSGRAGASDRSSNGSAARGGAGASSGGRNVWVYSNGTLAPVPVRLGISDGTVTELLESALPVGALVVTDVSSSTAQAATTTKRTTSPLTPSRPVGGPGGPPPM